MLPKGLAADGGASNGNGTSECTGPGCGCGTGSGINRRDFIRWTSLGVAGASIGVARWPAIAGPFTGADFEKLIPSDKKLDPAWVKSLYERGTPTSYKGPDLEKIGMPVGGICAGQMYLGGDGRLWHWDIFNTPQPPRFSDTGGPNYANPPKPESPVDQGFVVRVVGGGQATTRILDSRGFNPAHIAFRGQYPVGFVDYRDPALPVDISLEAFSPFVPLRVEDSSLPATVLRYKVKNNSAAQVEVEVAGWLENAVCPASGKSGAGQRRNLAVREGKATFVQCQAEKLPDSAKTVPRPEIVFETFEREDGYGGWEVEGQAFGKAPARGTLEGQQHVSGFLGKGLVNTFLKGDSTQGKLTSPPFKIERRFIAFLIGGGSQAGRTCVNLLLDGKQVRTATGHDEERLDWQEWDVAEFEGRTGRIEVVDQSTSGWGHINIDQIVFSDAPPSQRIPLEAREDYGSMALAVLGDFDKSFVRSSVPASPAEVLFGDGPGSHPDLDAVAPFGTPLIGAVGRRLSLAPGAEGEAVFILAWFFPGLMRGTLGPLQDIATVRRSYAKRFASAGDVIRHVSAQFDRLAGETALWNRTWYDSTLPYWFLDRTFIPICTLATSTCYQFDSGRFYAFEGVYCCQGTCQHVWNYAQSVARIFPELERDLRARTDFGTSWHENGAIDYRGECARHVAHDGQCGVILRAWREHQTAPDASFLKEAWPRIKRSIQHLMEQDRDRDGLLEGEQYNTLDAAWYGPMAWISSFFVASLRAGEAMAREVGDKEFEAACRSLAERGSTELVKQLYNGEYFIHKLDPAHPNTTNTNDGCHIDQLMGQAWAFQVGLPRILPAKETKSALQAIWKYNFTPDVRPFRDLSPIRGGRWYAMAGEGGVVMTTFPRGGVEKASGEGHFAYYFNEVWTGQEHQLAAHMLWEGMIEPALVITRVLHDRHHAGRRNPYNEVECSDHYTRAMSSHGTFLAACGFEHNNPAGHIGFAPKLSPENFRAPFTAAEGWGTFTQQRKAGEQTNTLIVAHGSLKLRTLSLEAAAGHTPGAATVRVVGVGGAGGGDVPATLRAQGQRLEIALGRETIITKGQALEIRIA